MARMIFKLAATVAAVPLCVHFLPGVHATSLEAALIAGGILALLYLVLRPIAKLITGVFNFFTLGLLSIFIDAWLVWLCTLALKGQFRVDGVLWTVVCALAVNVIRFVLGLFAKKEK